MIAVRSFDLFEDDPMKSLITLIAAGIVTLWVAATALIAVQNAGLVSLELAGQRSVELPFGLLLALSAGVGMVGMALLQPLLLGRARIGESED
jgi:hypothetical protein